LQKVAIGSFHHLAVPPDGCHAAFIYSPTLKEYLSPTKPYRTLKLIDFCN